MPGYQTLADIVALEQTPLSARPVAPDTFTMVQRGAARNPQALALRFVFNGEKPTESVDYTYGEVMARLHQTANLLHSLGVGPTDVVSYLLPNLPETTFVYCGGQAAGIVNPINPLLEPAQIADILNACGTKVLVTLRAFPKTDIWQKVAAIAPLVPTLETVVTVDLLPYLPLAQRLLVGALRLTQPKPALPGKRVVDFAASQRQPSDGLRTGRAIAPQDTACYFHTGGTTGTPKLAPLTHRNLAVITSQTELLLGTPDETGPLVFFCGLPLFHINGVVVTVGAPWSMGHTLLLGSPQGYRGPGIVANFWELVQHYRIALFSGVPTVFSRLLEVPTGGRDLTSLRYSICGAAPLSKETVLAFERHTGLRLAEGYGLTEASCTVTVAPVDGDRIAGSIGLRLPYQDVRIVVLDPATGQFQRLANPNESGTIAVRGENVFKGYLQPEHNQGIWIDSKDGQGLFYNTGDLGRQDENGYFYITGRQKELIIRGGHNIDPRVIEDALQLHPAVSLAAAIGSPDADAGELPVAYVTRALGQAVTEAELLTFAATQIPERAAVPKRIFIADELPLTAIGKIFKPALLKQEISRVYGEKLAAVPGLHVQHITVRDDSRRGLVADITATGGSGGASAADAVHRALAGYTVPYEVLPVK